MTKEFLEIINTFKKTKNIESLFSKITNREFLIDYMNLRLKELDLNKTDAQDVDINSQSPFVLYDCNQFIIKITYNKLSFQEVVETTPNEKYFVPLTNTRTIDYTIFCLDEIKNPAIFDKKLKLNLKVRKKLSTKEVIYVQSFYNLFCPNDNYEGFFMTLEYKQKSEFSWFFNMNTLTPVYYDFNSSSHKKIEGAIEILSEIGSDLSIETLIKLTSHNNHTIRWKSVNSLININFSEGIKCLEQMTSDSHPEIKEAAISSLISINRNLQNNGN